MRSGLEGLVDPDDGVPSLKLLRDGAQIEPREHWPQKSAVVNLTVPMFSVAQW